MSRWPQGYVRVGEEDFWVRRDLAAAFERMGWTSADQVLAWQGGRVVRQVDHRINVRGELPTGDGGTAVRFYMKKHVDEPLWPSILDACPASQRMVTSGVHEADAVGACQAAGVKTMSVIAAGQRLSRAGRADSFFISEHLPGLRPADDYWNEHLSSAHGATDAALAARREAMLTAMAQAAARLHDAGLFHRDCYWCHFMVGEDGGTMPSVHLIDLQRVHRPSQGTRARLKDLAQFFLSAPAGQQGPTRSEMSAWFAAYLDTDRLSVRQRAVLAVIRLRARLYRLKGLKA